MEVPITVTSTMLNAYFCSRPFTSPFSPCPFYPLCLYRSVVHAKAHRNHIVLTRLVSAAAAVTAETSPVVPVVEALLCHRRRRRGRPCGPMREVSLCRIPCRD
jgi:hypothetical protein